MAAGFGVAVLGGGTTAGAQTLSGVRIDQLQPASPESIFFRAEGPHNPAAEGVEFAVGATFELGTGLLRDNLFLKNGSQTTTTLVDDALLARISGSISPLHWLAFDVSLPISLFETGTSAPTVAGLTLNQGSGAGVGDLRIGAHFRVVDKTAVGVILGGRVWAPFGTQGTYLSDRGFRGEIDAAVAGDLGRVLYGCTLNLSPGFLARHSGDRMALGCAAHLKVGSIVSVGIEPSFEALTLQTISLPSLTTSNTYGVMFEPLAAVRLRFGGVRVGAAVGPGLGNAIGNAEVRALLNVAYVGLGKPPKQAPVGPPDRDLDKIPDDVDACPDEAGPPSPNPKLNGCPVHDRDGDGIRDEEDACPDRPGVPHPDKRANGCPDSDNDGLPDPIDQCVNEPGPPPTGCPKYAHLANGNFTIDPPIEFGTGEKLPAAGRAALEEVAATLRANPKIERISLSIGTKGVKAPISDKRAQEVLQILRAANLDSGRYEVVLRDDVKPGTVQVRIVK
jgi:hypothetical protein